MKTDPSTNNVRRFPRTLTEAFGPYTSQRVEPKPLTPEERAARDNRELVAATILAALAALAGVAGLFIVFSAGCTS